jgi:hypothetical protein
MSCKTDGLMLHSYINDELRPIEKAELERHLKQCPECRNEAEEIRKLKLIISSMKPDKVQLNNIKGNIMAAIKVTAKASAAVYDFKVLGRVGRSLVACGILVFFLSFSTISSDLEVHSDRLNIEMQGIGKKLTQPLSMINRGITDMSTKLVDLNGITFRLEQKIRGGKKNEM